MKEKKKKKRGAKKVKRSVTRRWLINTFGIIVIVLVLINVVFSLSISSYFYNSARQMLIASANSNFNLIQSYSSDSTKNITTEIQNLVRNYADKDKIELMAINYKGEVADTSSGFLVEDGQEMPDYQQTLNSSDGAGFAILKLPNGEEIMAYCQLIQVTNNEYSALRYVVSLRDIRSLTLQLSLILITISAVILIFVIISGSFFVSSIVRPVGEISNAVKKITGGDLSVRVHRRADDELGNLCDTINEMADELSHTEQLKNEFISSISHELRTPLTAIQGWSETMLSVGTEDRDTLQKGMKVISKETERLSGMVEDLLDFSRIQGGNFRLNKDRMDVLAELEEAVLVYAERAKHDDKILTYEESEMLPVIFGDKNRIRQVFINIIDNALKYTDPGDKIRVSSVVDEQQITVTIEDSGCGISEKDLPLVREKFYKANNTRPGSGIGLAVSAEIVEMHDGTLDIQSKEGEGTTVTIRLPIYEGEAEKIVQTFTDPVAPSESQ